MSQERQKFYEQHRSIFSWYDADEYACFEVLPVAPELTAAIQQASEAVWRVLVQAGEIMKRLDDDALVAFGYPPESLKTMRATTQPPFIARCDFAVTSEGIYLLECNAEVATFIVETFRMNGLVATHLGYEDVNEQAESVLKRELNLYLKIAAAYIGKAPEDCRIAFAALSQAAEDIGTVEYLRSLCQYPAVFCPIEQIEMDNLGAYDSHNQPIDLIYRVYPTEWMIEDHDPVSGVSLWGALEPLLRERRVALINPVSAFVLQNKALLALITEVWGNPSDDLLTQIVQQHFLPTFMQPTLAPPYVAKPTFGREGKEVEIVQDSESTLYYASADYAALPKVFQKYIQMPSIQHQGKIHSLQFSCFLMNGIAAGVGVRIGDTVIGNTSKFLPIGYRND